jgi:hypothetical protein
MLPDRIQSVSRLGEIDKGGSRVPGVTTAVGVVIREGCNVMVGMVASGSNKFVGVCSGMAGPVSRKVGLDVRSASSIPQRSVPQAERSNPVITNRMAALYWTEFIAQIIPPLDQHLMVIVGSY